jgi:putative protease
MKKTELLAPAGNLEKLKLVFRYGADAAYIGGKQFSLRAYADNFTDGEIKNAVQYARERGKKVYVAVNIFAKNADFPAAIRHLQFLESLQADGAILTDPGLIRAAREYAPALPIHLSTQANTLNSFSAAFWAAQGVKRIVLARELSFADIREIKKQNPYTGLEVFVHGAMCVSYSGRCLLSNYLSDRDANRGECVQACRWRYKLTPVSAYADEAVFAEEDERGTYLMNSKDLNLLDDLGALIDAGVTSFKIEGRMKSEYYLATVVNAYRRALDEYLNFGKIINAALYNDELLKITHRNYTKAYMRGNNATTVSYGDEQGKVGYEFTALVLGYENGFAKVEMRNRFKTGDFLEVLSPSVVFNSSFTVDVIIGNGGERVTDAKLVQEILQVKIPFAVAKGDIFRKRL